MLSIPPADPPSRVDEVRAPPSRMRHRTLARLVSGRLGGKGRENAPRDRSRHEGGLVRPLSRL